VVLNEVLYLMKYLISISLQLAAVAVLGSNVSAKSWHGITPLHSTRADVEKLWGQPLPPPPTSGRAYTLNENRSIYFIDEGEVYVLYARFTLTCDKSITPDTVLWLSLRPKRKTQLSDLHIEESKFTTYDPAEPKGTGYKAYTNEAEGYSILTFKGLVEQIYYQPTADDRKLCPFYFENGACIPFSILIH
jgi:hypothetical protein